MEMYDVEDLTISHDAMNDGEIYFFKIHEIDDDEEIAYQFWMNREQAISMAKEILRVLDGQE